MGGGESDITSFPDIHLTGRLLEPPVIGRLIFLQHGGVDGFKLARSRADGDDSQNESSEQIWQITRAKDEDT